MIEVTDKTEKLFKKLDTRFKNIIETDEFAQLFIETIKMGENRFYQTSKSAIKRFDRKFIDTLEGFFPHLDQVVRDPKRFIKTFHDVVDVEKAKKTDRSSVKHLAANSHLVRNFNEGVITPKRVQTVLSDDEFGIYENRFIKTLIEKLFTFIEKRYQLIKEQMDVASERHFKVDSNIVSGPSKVRFGIEIDISDKLSEEDVEVENNILFERLEVLRQMVIAFRGSKFMEQVREAKPIIPPVMQTNIMMMEPNYRKCFELWKFIDSYDQLGFNLEIEEKIENFSDEYINEIYNTILLAYATVKNQNRRVFKLDSYKSIRERKRVLKPKVTKKFKYARNEFGDIIEVEEVGKLTSIQRGSIDKQKEKDKERVAKQKAKEFEKARLAKEKEKERLAKEKEKEKERIAKEKEKEKGKSAKNKEREKGKAKLAKEKEHEKAKLAAQKEREKGKVRLAKEKEAEKAKLVKEKEASKPVAPIEKVLPDGTVVMVTPKVKKPPMSPEDREKAKLAAQEAKEKDKEQQRLELQRAKEADKTRLSKEKEVEKAKLAKEKEVEKARLAKAKEVEKEKAKLTAQKAREKEKARLAKEKETTKAAGTKKPKTTTAKKELKLSIPKPTTPKVTKAPTEIVSKPKVEKAPVEKKPVVKVEKPVKTPVEKEIVEPVVAEPIVKIGELVASEVEQGQVPETREEINVSIDALIVPVEETPQEPEVVDEIVPEEETPYAAIDEVVDQEDITSKDLDGEEPVQEGAKSVALETSTEESEVVNAETVIEEEHIHQVNKDTTEGITFFALDLGLDEPAPITKSKQDSQSKKPKVEKPKEDSKKYFFDDERPVVKGTKPFFDTAPTIKLKGHPAILIEESIYDVFGDDEVEYVTDIEVETKEEDNTDRKLSRQEIKILKLRQKLDKMLERTSQKSK